MLRIIISLTMPLPVAFRVVLHLRRSWVCRQTGTGRSITSIPPIFATKFLTLSLFTLSNSALRQAVWRLRGKTELGSRSREKLGAAAGVAGSWECENLAKTEDAF